nr:hypothetical protein [Tanacetum cinerariifolium]
SLKEQHQTYSSQRHCQRSRRLLEDILVSWDGYQRVLNQAKNLGLPLPHALATFGMTAEDKKRKRNETLKEVFVKELIDVDGTKRNITPPSGVVGKEGIVIREPEAGFFYVNENFDLAFQRESEFYLIVKGLSECRASKSNIRRIQVKDIVKEVEDYLKTYSSAGMDINEYVEGIR